LEDRASHAYNIIAVFAIVALFAGLLLHAFLAITIAAVVWPVLGFIYMGLLLIAFCD
jgi:hypothetical protein